MHLSLLRSSLLVALCATAACAAQTTPAGSTATAQVGLEVLLRDPPPELRGLRLGLITNHTGVDSRRVSGIDLITSSPDLELTALFAPEHGLRGVAGPGEQVESGRDPRTGLPVHSLYGETRSPTPEMLAEVDALLFDMQDVGARQYTYISTMSLAMRAAAHAGVPIYVLDRPNPIGGDIVEGGLLDPEFASFVGIHPIASRHGMTVGELAGYFNERFGIGADLSVVRMEGWRREMWFDRTGLPWVNPSPNIRRLEAAVHYPGTVYLEGTNLSEGRGTELPFEQTGAPWLRADEVAAAMNGLDLPGVRFESVRLSVEQGAAKYPGEQGMPGIRLRVTDRESYRPLEATLRLIAEIRRQHPDDFAWSGSLDRLAGTDALRRAIDGGELDALLRNWRDEAERFRVERAPYLLYQ